MAPKRTSIINFKGGTGKTTLAINISHALARKGERGLLIDCDLLSTPSSLRSFGYSLDVLLVELVCDLSGTF
jgi:chromosome partitioning protein